MVTSVKRINIPPPHPSPPPSPLNPKPEQARQRPRLGPVQISAVFVFSASVRSKQPSLGTTLGYIKHAGGGRRGLICASFKRVKLGRCRSIFPSYNEPTSRPLAAQLPCGHPGPRVLSLSVPPKSPAGPRGAQCAHNGQHASGPPQGASPAPSPCAARHRWMNWVECSFGCLKMLSKKARPAPACARLVTGSGVLSALQC